LVESELVSGWLAEAEIDPSEGGRFDLLWDTNIGLPATRGTIAQIIPEQLVVVDLLELGRLAFTLREVDSGTRGTSTALTVSLWSQPQQMDLAAIAAPYLSDFDQLERLLHGHHRSQESATQYPAVPVHTPRRLS